MTEQDKKIFEVLETKGRELSEWLRANFHPYTKIVITATNVSIDEEQYVVPIVEQKVSNFAIARP